MLYVVNLIFVSFFFFFIVQITQNFIIDLLLLTTRFLT